MKATNLYVIFTVYAIVKKCCLKAYSKCLFGGG